LLLAKQKRGQKTMEEMDIMGGEKGGKNLMSAKKRKMAKR